MENITGCYLKRVNINMHCKKINYFNKKKSSYACIIYVYYKKYSLFTSLIYVKIKRMHY